MITAMITVISMIMVEVRMFLDDFIIKAIVAGLAIAIITGLTGCFVVWRRMAYFGDSLAHSALLGIALGIAFGMGISLGIFLISATFALLLFWLEQRGILATDTLLGILAHGSLSTAMVIMSFQAVPLDLHAFLFGDILTVTNNDLFYLYLSGAVIVGLMLRYWSQLLLMTLNIDLARAEGVSTRKMQILFLTMMTLVVAASVQMVGVLLITSMLIIPAATARLFASSPTMMALFAAVAGIAAVFGGIWFSVMSDAPTGPSIIACLAVLFALSTLCRQIIIR